MQNFRTSQDTTPIWPRELVPLAFRNSPVAFLAREMLPTEQIEKACITDHDFWSSLSGEEAIENEIRAYYRLKMSRVACGQAVSKSQRGRNTAFTNVLNRSIVNRTNPASAQASPRMFLRVSELSEWVHFNTKLGTGWADQRSDWNCFHEDSYKDTFRLVSWWRGIVRNSCGLQLWCLTWYKFLRSQWD